MKKSIFIISVIVLALVGSCRKPYEYVEPKITGISDWSNGTWAIIRGEVNFLGEKHMFVEIGKQPDLSDAQRYEMQKKGDYEFTKSFENLDFGSTYYYRVEVVNANFSLFSEVKHFKISEAVLMYGDGSYEKSWGLINGGTDEWAIMFPSDWLSSFQGLCITKVRAYVSMRGDYYVNIYTGGTSSPNTLQKKQSFAVASTGWQVISINPLSLDASQSLWVSIETASAYEAGEHPKGAGKGVWNKNARWQRANGGSWRDVYNSNENRDLTWLIQVYVNADAKGEKGLEIELPQMPIGQEQEEYAKDCCGNSNR